MHGPTLYMDYGFVMLFLMFQRIVRVGVFRIPCENYYTKGTLFPYKNLSLLGTRFLCFKEIYNVYILSKPTQILIHLLIYLFI